MEYSDIQPLINAYHRKLSATDLRFRRYLYADIDWNVRLLGINGARGVGKTTLLLQHNFDEVHKYKDWTTLLKNFYDNYPDLNIVYTGSAMLAIENSSADLSRRQSLYTLHGLSFREYLEYENVINLPPIGLESLVADHVRYAMDAVSEIRVLKYFDKYLMSGYYPYYKEAGEDYLMRLSEVAGIVIESDIPAIGDITYSTMQKMKSLLMVIAENVPLEPNIT